MRIDKSRQYDALADIKFLRGPCFGQRFNFRARAHCGNHALADQYRAVFNDAELGEGFAAARNAPAKRQQLRRASDEQVGRQTASIMPQVARGLACALRFSDWESVNVRSRRGLGAPELHAVAALP